MKNTERSGATGTDAGRRRALRQRAKGSSHTTSWLFVLMLMLLAISVWRGVGWFRESRALAAKQASLEKKIEQEKYRLQQLLEYREYMKTDEYIEDIAGSDLGMVYDGEIIFKEDN